VSHLAVSLLIVICALGVALITAACAAVAVWRARSTADDRVAEAVRRLADEMHETMHELTRSAAETEAAPQSERFVEELAASLDFDDVAERTIEAVGALPGVDAVSIDAPAPEGASVGATLGLLPEEAARTAVRLPDNDNLRALEVSFRYRIDDVEGAAGLVRSGIVVPLRAGGSQFGSLSAYARSSQRPLSDEEVEAIERLAFRAGPALENARRYSEARALADLDALTGLHNRRYFHETLAREIARAHRYRRRLALVVVDLDDFKAVNDRVGHLAGDGVLAEVAERLLSVVRSADIPCRVGGDEFAVVMPESGPEDAGLLGGRIAKAVGTRPIANVGTLSLSAGVAELREGDGPSDLFERADDALYRAKELGKARTIEAGGA
jgi:diguanylate cyclase (GGDEF)-like protein